MKRIGRKIARQRGESEGGGRHRAAPCVAVSDQAAWIHQQQNGLFRYLRLLGADAHEAEDLMQDAFVAMLRRYDDEAPPAKVRLLFAIARNRLIASRRGRQHRQLVEWSDAVDRVAEQLQLQRSGALTLLQRSRDLLRACLERRGVAGTNAAIRSKPLPACPGVPVEAAATSPMQPNNNR
ncbi:MAG: RNA polymerase sigma factor [Planctomycetota bacterium]